jgi:hypothetical protein
MRWFQPTSHGSESESGRARLPQARCPALILKVHRPMKRGKLLLPRTGNVVALTSQSRA